MKFPVRPLMFCRICLPGRSPTTIGFVPTTTQRREHPVDPFNREGLGIELADPVEDFLVALMVGIAEGLDQIIESWYASTVFRWTRKLTIPADGIRGVRINVEPPLQHKRVLPAIAKIVRINCLGPNPAQYPVKTHSALAFHSRHSHEPVFRVGPTDASLANGEFVHVAVL